MKTIYDFIKPVFVYSIAVGTLTGSLGMRGSLTSGNREIVNLWVHTSTVDGDTQTFLALKLEMELDGEAFHSFPTVKLHRSYTMLHIKSQPHSVAACCLRLG